MDRRRTQNISCWIREARKRRLERHL